MLARPAWSTPAAPASSCCSTCCSTWSTAARCPSRPSGRRRSTSSWPSAGPAHADGERRRTATVGRPALRGHVLPRGPRRHHPGVQGRVGRHRRLDRRGRRRRHLELPHPHRRHRRRRSRPPSTPAARARSGSPTSSSRSRRSAGSARPRPAEPADARNGRSPTAVVAVATGDGIRRIFHSLGVQRIVTGGQSMNPSTAQLLEAVEAAPADQVVILPEQQEHHPGGRAGRRRRPRRRCASCRPEGIAEGFAALLAYDPEADGRRQRRGDGRGRRRRSSPARSPRRCATRPATLGPITEGDYLGIARDGIRAVDAAGSTAAPPSCSTLLVDRRPRDRHDHRGRGLDAGDTRHITEWLAEHHPDVTRRGPPRRPAALPVPLRHRVGAAIRRDGPRRPSCADRLPGHRARRGRARAGRGARQARHRARVLDLLTHYPRRYLDRTKRGAASATSTSARRRWCSPRSRR